MWIQDHVSWYEFLVSAWTTRLQISFLWCSNMETSSRNKVFRQEPVACSSVFNIHHLPEIFVFNFCLWNTVHFLAVREGSMDKCWLTDYIEVYSTFLYVCVVDALSWWKQYFEHIEINICRVFKVLSISVFFLSVLFLFFPPPQGLESCLKGPDNYNSQVLIEATVIALTKLQPLLSKV